MTPEQLEHIIKKKLKTTQDAFAKEIGWSPAYISMALSGKKKILPRFENAVKLYLYKVKNMK